MTKQQNHGRRTTDMGQNSLLPHRREVWDQSSYSISLPQKLTFPISYLIKFPEVYVQAGSTFARQIQAPTTSISNFHISGSTFFHQIKGNTAKHSNLSPKRFYLCPAATFGTLLLSWLQLLLAFENCSWWKLPLFGQISDKGRTIVSSVI